MQCISGSYTHLHGWKVFPKIQVGALITSWDLCHIFRFGEIARPMAIGYTWAHKISKTSPNFWARKFCLLNLKKLRSASFQLIRYNNERVTVNFKCKPTCNILISLNIWGCQNCFIWSWIGKELINCLR